MHLIPPSAAVRAGLLVPSLVLLAACGSSDPSPAASSGTTPAATVPAAGSSAAGSSAAGSATEVTVTATEFAFELSQQEFTPGSYTFVLDDAGSATHALTVTGPGVDESSDTVGPGDRAELTVQLQAGDYELLCPVGNHAAQGMRTTITVG